MQALNSAIIKISKLTRATSVYRGISGASLPAEFLTVDPATGVRGGVEFGFSSMTTEHGVATKYATVEDEKKASIIIEASQGLADRGADISWCSQVIRGTREPSQASLVVHERSQVSLPIKRVPPTAVSRSFRTRRRR